MIEFHWAWVFYLIPLPLLIYWLAPASKSQQAALQVPDINLWHDAQTADSHAQKHLSTLLLPLLIWLCLLGALARPYLLGEPLALPISGRDLMLAVDISGSMQQQDMQLNQQPASRLEVVKKIVHQFIRKRQSDRIGLVLFGTQAYIQAPLTFDSKTVNILLNEAQIGLAGKSTAIGDAIGLVSKRFMQQKAQNKVLILLTDGANTAGVLNPLKAAKIAAQAGIKIYTIGIGAESMQVSGLFGIFGSRTINPSQDLDEKSLQEIAQLTGGKYFRAKNTQELAEIYRIIEQLEPIEQDPEILRPKKSLSHWLIALALGLLLISRLLTPLSNWFAQIRNKPHAR